MAFPQDLLEQAGHLARREPTRPKQASLRRAVSTAYYALFHLLISEATSNWKRVAQRHSLGRAFDHGPMRKACERKIAEIHKFIRTNRALSPHLTGSNSLFSVIETFAELRRQRNSADYDGSRRWSRKEANYYIDRVGTAFESWPAIRATPEAQDFLISLLLKDR